MGTSWAIFTRDLRKIVRNPIAIAIVLGIAIVPCLYAWINILANWDPYANTSGMPVAVVNEDSPVTLEGKGEICAGDLMVEALKENDAIGWQFLGQDEALEGVRAGRYYAAIVIPKDFTAHLTGILDGKTEKAQLKYYVNEKANAIAPKVTDTGATTIETQIQEKFTATAGEVISEKLGTALGTIVDKSQAAVGKASTALDEVHVALVDVDTQLGGLSDSLTKAKDALANASRDLSALSGTGTTLADGVGNTLGNIAQVRADANQLLGDIGTALGNAGSTLSNVSTNASADVNTLVGDIASAKSQVDAAIRALEGDLTDGQGLHARLSTAREATASTNPSDAAAAEARVSLINDLDTQINVVVQLNDAQEAKLNELRAISARLDGVLSEVRALSDTINGNAQSAINALTGAQTGSIGTSLQQISNALDTFVQVAQRLETAARAVDPIVAQTSQMANDLSATMDKTTGALTGTRSSLSALDTDVQGLRTDLASVQASDTWALLKELAGTDPEGVKEFLSAPVEIDKKRLFPVDNYGSGVAPFFTSVALWVGGIALVAIFKLEVDVAGFATRVRPWQAYFGRWLLFVLVGALQAIVCCTGDLIIGIQCAHPWAFYLSAIVASFAFVNVIFALSVAFKHLGKALAFTLIILQVPGSAGMYPIEMMPPFFQALGPWLPFTYSNNALREAVGGLYDGYLINNLIALLLFVIPSILVGVTARSHLVNINALFDKRLRETDHLMVSEPVAIEGNRYRLATVVKALHAPEEYRAEFDERSAAFERAYPALRRRGVAALFLVPLALFGLLLITGATLPLIACWVASLVAVYVYNIVIEFYHDRITTRRALTDLSEDELKEVLVDTLRDEPMPFAPVDAILERRARRQDTGLLGRVRSRIEARNADADGDGEPGADGNEPAAQDASGLVAEEGASDVQRADDAREAGSDDASQDEPAADGDARQDGDAASETDARADGEGSAGDDRDADVLQRTENTGDAPATEVDSSKGGDEQ